MVAWLGPAISAIGSIAGGFLGSQGQQSANRLAEAQFDYNAQKQEEYFKNAVLFRVQDAKRAGVHPLAALGANIQSPPAISVGGGVADTALGSGLAAAGQDIGRAVSSMKSEDEKVRAFRDAINAASLSKPEAEIDYIRSMTARNIGLAAPGIPRVVANERMIPGQGNAPLNTLSLINPGSEGSEVSKGVVPDISHLSTRHGEYPAPSSKAKDMIEDNFWHQSAHFFRNNILPFFDRSAHTPPRSAPEGYRWKFSPVWGYRLQKIPSYVGGEAPIRYERR